MPAFGFEGREIYRRIHVSEAQQRRVGCAQLDLRNNRDPQLLERAPDAPFAGVEGVS